MAKKTFPCGHKGKGQYCHRCAQEARQQQTKQQEQAEQQRWQQQFDHDPINLRRLSKRSLVEKARAIIAAIAAGRSYTEFRGKRLNHDRSVISVPVNRSYRLIYHETDRGLDLQSLMSHEEYNVKKPGAR